jgi:hypothetical protein
MSRSLGKVIFVAASGHVIAVQNDRGFAVVELQNQRIQFARNSEVSGDWSASGPESLFLGRKRFGARFQGSFGCMEEAVQAARRIGGG